MKLTHLTILCLLCCRTFAQKIDMVDRNWVTQMNQNTSDTIYVINFWATWCKPCVEEIPYFEKLHTNYSAKKVKVIMVSCDFKKQLDSRVVPFVKKKQMKASVVFMNESNPDNWIDKVDPAFSGAIPATLIIKGKHKFRYFSEGETTYQTLETIIKPLIE